MAELQLTTPVAFMIFNRPETTARVFEAIRKARPSRLLVVADGPRPNRPDDIEKCADTRAIIDGVDWECQVLINYAETNLGCKRRVASGLAWVFGTVKEAIILEDDCLPHSTFFQFCEELLEKYRDDDRVMHISGDNFLPGQKRTGASYYFSHYPHVWGWASWRRAWQHYDCDMHQWPALRETDWLLKIGDGKTDFQRYWTRIFDNAYATGRVDTWDYQWIFSCWLQEGLSVLPSKNLVSNIGFGIGSTHTSGDGERLGRRPLESMSFPLCHPKEMIRDQEADRWTDLNVVGTSVSIAQRILVKASFLFREYISMRHSR